MKPTAAIVNAVIEHIVSNSGRLSVDIQHRDNHPRTRASSVSCRFVEEFSNPSQLIFDLDFAYIAPPNLERNDDIAVRIEVTEQAGSLQFRIVDLRQH